MTSVVAAEDAAFRPIRPALTTSSSRRSGINGKNMTMAIPNSTLLIMIAAIPRLTTFVFKILKSFG